MAHRTIDPTILYWGTPVALITTISPDGAECPLLYVFRHHFGTGEELGRTYRAED